MTYDKFKLNLKLFDNRFEYYDFKNQAIEIEMHRTIICFGLDLIHDNLTFPLLIFLTSVRGLFKEKAIFLFEINLLSILRI